MYQYNICEIYCNIILLDSLGWPVLDTCVYTLTPFQVTLAPLKHKIGLIQIILCKLVYFHDFYGKGQKTSSLEGVKVHTK